MSSPHENTVFDFDLDFLNQSSTNNAEPDPHGHANRLRKSIIFLKQRITKIDKLTVTCKVLKKENEELRNSEMQLKQQCGQHLLEISYFIGKVTKLENEIKAVETREREKIESINDLEIKILALESVNNQLKFLEKEHNKTESTPVKVERKKGNTGVTNKDKGLLIDKEAETLSKDKDILTLEKENEKLRKDSAKIPNLEKEIENLRKKNSLLSKSDSVSNNAIARNKKLEKEIETLYKENAKITNLEKEIEILQKENVKIPILEIEIENLQKENAKIPNFKKKIENLQKENAKIPTLERKIENLQKENAKIPTLERKIENLQKENEIISNYEKEIENLQKENVKIRNFEKEIENLQKENAIIPKLMKEIEKLQKENAKIAKLVKEIEILHEENAKITNLGNENETVLEQTVKILNLEKDIHREIIKIPNKGNDIETVLTYMTSTTKEKGQLQPRCNKLKRKYKSLPDIRGQWNDNSEAENYVFEDPLLSPTRNDTIIAENFPIADKDIGTRESDSDTGRGSSLGNSDTDKGLHSPEYFLNCAPSNGVNIENKAKPKDATITRGPILLEEIETPAITIVKPNEYRNTCEAKSVSHRKSHSKLISTVNQSNAAIEVTNSVDTDADNVSLKKRIQSVQEKECLEMNNRLHCDSHTDLELQNIFSSMNLNYNAVSPIPRTPISVHEVDSTNSSSVLNVKLKLCNEVNFKVAEFMRTFMGYVVSQDRDDNSFMINECDKLFVSLESILKSKQVGSDNPVHLTTSNLEISGYIPNRMLWHDENRSRSILNNPESTTSLSSATETDIFLNKKGENRLSHNKSLSTLQNRGTNQLLRDDNNSLVTISNQSLPDKDTNILRKIQEQNQNQLFNNSVSEDLAMDSEISTITDSVRRSRDIEDIDQPPIKNIVGKRAKNKKNTKLEKLKKKLKPKYKIKREPEIVRIKRKQVLPIKNNVSVTDTSAALNDKAAYEKAVKFMAEMKSQQEAKAKSPNRTKVLMSPTHSACLGKDINSSRENQIIQDCPTTTRSKRKFSELFDTCPLVLIKDSLLLSPCKAKNSTTHETEELHSSTSHRANEHYKSSTHTAKEDNNSTTHRGKEDNNSTTHMAKEDNNSTTHRAKEDNNSTTHRAKEDNNSTTHRAEEDNNSTTHREKEDNIFTTHRAKEDNNSTTHRAKGGNNSTTRMGEEDNKSSDELPSKQKRRRSSNEPHIQYKRVLRSATVQTRLSIEDNNELSNSIGKSKSPNKNESGTQFNNETTLQCSQLDRHNKNVVSYGDLDVFSGDIQISAPIIAKEENNSMINMGAEQSSDEPLRKRRRRSSNQPLIQHKIVSPSAPVHTRLSMEENIELSKSTCESNRKSIMGLNTNESDTKINKETLPRLDCPDKNVVSYGDLDVFSENIQLEKKTSAPVREVKTNASACQPEESILCYMIEKHARDAVRSYGKKLSDKKIDQLCEKIEQDIITIAETNDRLHAMNNFVADLRKIDFDLLIAALVKYLTKPERKFELLGKVVISPFSAMTKTEHILLYAISQLKSHWPSIVDTVLLSIEFTLFKLNRTPEFDVVESASHFYALLCKNYNAINRLKLFMLDAMYCIQFKAVPLIKQCLEVWKELIPFPHMRIAKSPMVTCFVYLLHFYKCEDKLNRVQEMRNILRHRYHYQITNWNETRILEMFKNSIKNLKDDSDEKKQLRFALIIIAKRNGPKWCQNHIIKNLLQPMIEKENVPNYVKEFCVSMIGPLMKPYPVDMKVHCEIQIIQLVKILNNNPSPQMEEAAITSMLYINRHDHHIINKTLLSRKMKPMSSELEQSIRNYVKSKPLKIWKTILLNKEYKSIFSSQ